MSKYKDMAKGKWQVEQEKASKFKGDVKGKVVSDVYSNPSLPPLPLPAKYVS